MASSILGITIALVDIICGESRRFSTSIIKNNFKSVFLYQHLHVAYKSDFLQPLRHFTRLNRIINIHYGTILYSTRASKAEDNMDKADLFILVEDFILVGDSTLVGDFTILVGDFTLADLTILVGDFFTFAENSS
jgi:hypothetical protein